MKKQELQAVQELYNLVHQWQEEYTVGWVDTSDLFKRFYRGVKHLVKSLQVLTNTEYLPCKTVEEKVANAVFYVDQGVQYRITYYINTESERYFVAIDEEGNGEEFTLDFDSVPANSYFLGTHKL